MSRMAGGAASLLKEGTKLTEKDEVFLIRHNFFFFFFALDFLFILRFF